jgi:cell wall-associated NlpC family hydrolase
MTSAPRAAQVAALCSFIAALALFAIAAAPAPASAAPPGGLSAHTSSETVDEPTVPGALAQLVDGRAVAPLEAPAAVRKVIAAANRIRTKPYIWGGGHGRWWDAGYDCSGAVSFALRGGGFVASPLPSGPMESWGAAGLGKWITVFANSGHAYAVIAGLRWDTSGNRNGESGPRWHQDMADSRGFVARHPSGY